MVSIRIFPVNLVLSLDKSKYLCIIVYTETKRHISQKGALAMLDISPKTNLLEQKNYKYSLQDVAEPNLHRHI